MPGQPPEAQPGGYSHRNLCLEVPGTGLGLHWYLPQHCCRPAWKEACLPQSSAQRIMAALGLLTGLKLPAQTLLLEVLSKWSFSGLHVQDLLVYSTH